MCFQLFSFINIKHARQIETVGLNKKNRVKNFNNSNGVKKYTGRMHIDIGTTGNTNTNQNSASFAQRQPNSSNLLKPTKSSSKFKKKTLVCSPW